MQIFNDYHSIEAKGEIQPEEVINLVSQDATLTTTTQTHRELLGKAMTEGSKSLRMRQMQ